MSKYNQKTGEFGENLAKKYLLRHGYEILGSNIKISYQEIDIIAKIKEKIVFIEVKTRCSKVLGRAEDSISDAKINNLKKAINLYIETKKINANNIRLDLVAIDICFAKKIAKIRHFKDIL